MVWGSGRVSWESVDVISCNAAFYVLLCVSSFGQHLGLNLGGSLRGGSLGSSSWQPERGRVEAAPMLSAIWI